MFIPVFGSDMKAIYIGSPLIAREFQVSLLCIITRCLVEGTYISAFKDLR